MKKSIFCAIATLVVSVAAVVGVKAYNYYSMPELMRANLEALSLGDVNKPVGRWRTVACGGASIAHMKTYCCPHTHYDNCPYKGDCGEDLSKIVGCNN